MFLAASRALTHNESMISPVEPIAGSIRWMIAAFTSSICTSPPMRSASVRYSGYSRVTANPAMEMIVSVCNRTDISSSIPVAYCWLVSPVSSSRSMIPCCVYPNR